MSTHVGIVPQEDQGTPPILKLHLEINPNVDVRCLTSWMIQKRKQKRSNAKRPREDLSQVKCLLHKIYDKRPPLFQWQLGQLTGEDTRVRLEFGQAMSKIKPAGPSLTGPPRLLAGHKGVIDIHVVGPIGAILVPVLFGNPQSALFLHGKKDPSLCGWF